MKDYPFARNWMVSSDMVALWDAAPRWYRLPKRHYHNLAHADHVVNILFSLAAPTPALILAARWHDAVYIPGAPLNVNEDASAAALGMEARRLPLNTKQYAILLEAQTLIRLTSMDMHMSRKLVKGDVASLLDADISSMGAVYKTFVSNQKKIVYEQTGQVPTLEGLAKSSAWLTEFAARRHKLFHTIMGRDMFESQARANIKRFAKEYGAK